MKKFTIIFILGISIGLIPTVFAITALTGKFSDVPNGLWYTEAVNSLEESGIIEGYKDNTFRPSNNVNRAELAVMLNRMLNYLERDKYWGTFRYCVTGNYPMFEKPENHLVPQEELNIIKSLFDLNDLDYSNYQFYNLLEDRYGHRHIACYQFINGLKIFTGLIFHFDQTDKYSSLSGDLITEINLDTEPSMDQRNVIEKYVNELDNDDYFFDSFSIDSKEEIKNGCFDLEFGYYDLNAGTSNTDENFTKAWKVKPKDKEYPFAYINDMTSETIYYDNGIRY